jgi:hypothetical protein
VHVCQAIESRNQCLASANSQKHVTAKAQDISSMKKKRSLDVGRSDEGEEDYEARLEKIRKVCCYNAVG